MVNSVVTGTGRPPPDGPGLGLVARVRHGLGIRGGSYLAQCCGQGVLRRGHDPRSFAPKHRIGSMPSAPKLHFAPLSAPAKGVLVTFCEEGLKLGPATRRALAPTGDLIARAAAAERFKGKNGSALDIVAPSGLDLSRLIVL